MRDAFGAGIMQGDRIIYMTASKSFQKLYRGTVQEVGKDYVIVWGDGNTKCGRLEYSERIYRIG
jgi:hypothetical protein